MSLPDVQEIARRLDRLPCASPGCVFPRHRGTRRRRWCRVHLLLRALEISNNGGGDVVQIGDHR